MDVSSSDLPSCPCGTNRESKFAVGEREYSLAACFYLFWGGTAIPTKVRFRCVKCNRYFETVTGSQQRMRKYTV